MTHYVYDEDDGKHAVSKDLSLLERLQKAEEENERLLAALEVIVDTAPAILELARVADRMRNLLPDTDEDAEAFDVLRDNLLARLDEAVKEE